MKFAGFTFESVLLFFTGSSLLLLSVPEIHLSLLTPIESAFLRERSTVLTGLLIAYGAALVVLSFWSGYLARRGARLAGKIARHMSDAHALVRGDLLPVFQHPFKSRRTVAGLLVVLCIGISVRAYFLAQPLRYDEAYTFLKFVNGHVVRLFDYPYPNNHVLHTIFVKFSTMLWGSHPWTIRLPALIAGIASIPLMFCVSRTLLRERSGTFAAVLIAVFPYLVLYSTLARGYSTVVFLTLALIWVAAQTAQAPSIAASAILSIIAAFGLLTIPSMAFAIAGIYLWYGCLLLINGNKVNRVISRFAVPGAVMTAGFAAVLYTPVIFVSKGIGPLLDNDYIRAQPTAEFISKIYPHAAATLADFSRDIPAAVLISFIALMVIGTYAAAKKGDWPVLLLLPAVFSASAILLFIKHAIPFPRTWIFSIPIAILLVNAGWAYCLEALPVKIQGCINRATVLAGGVYALSLIASNAIAKYPDTGTFPEAPRIADSLKALMKKGDKVYASVPADYPTYFYLWYHGLSDFRVKEDDDGDHTKYIIVQKDGYLTPNPIGERVEEPMEKLIELSDAAVFRIRPADDQSG